MLRGDELCKWDARKRECQRAGRDKRRPDRCWTCSARDREVTLRTATGRLLLLASEADFSARNGRGPEADSLAPPVEAAWRVLVEERLEWEDEAQRKAMEAAAKGRPRL